MFKKGFVVFLENAQELLEAKVEACRRRGWIGLPPADNADFRHLSDRRAQARGIYLTNLDRMAQAQAIIANITPFRGPHMDPGTAFEVGYFASRRQRIVVYTQDPKTLVDRVEDWSGTSMGAGHELRDRNAHLVENFGFSENLMIPAAALQSGLASGVVITSAGPQGAFQCCKGFEQALDALEVMWDC